MRCVVKRPGQEPKVMDIANRLEALQAMVGGYIETVPFGDHLAIVNEEGRIMGLPPNFLLPGGTIYGTAVICETQGEEFRGLTGYEAKEVLQMFAEAAFRRDRGRGFSWRWRDGNET